MNNSRVKLDDFGYIAGTSPFPENQEALEGYHFLFLLLVSISISAINVIFEGIPFFGDVLLRLPDITKKASLRRVPAVTTLLHPLLVFSTGAQVPQERMDVHFEVGN